MKHTLEIGGRKWREISRSTMENDVWLWKHIRDGGIDQVRLQPGEKPEDYAVRLLHEVIASGKVFLLLGGLLLPDGVPDEHWAPERGEETAAFMRKLQDQTDKDAIRHLLINLLTAFFEGGLRSYVNSLTASKAEEGEPAEQQPQSIAAPIVPPY